MLNELRRTRGHAHFGGTVTYGEPPLQMDALMILVPQTAWIQSGSIRANIEFGRDGGNLEETVDACGLQADLAAWPAGIE